MICSALSSVTCSPSKLKYLSEPFNVITDVPFNASSNVVCELTFSQTGSTKSTISLSESVPFGSFLPIVKVLVFIIFPEESFARGIASVPSNTISTKPL